MKFSTFNLDGNELDEDDDENWDDDDDDDDDDNNNDDLYSFRYTASLKVTPLIIYLFLLS